MAEFSIRSIDDIFSELLTEKQTLTSLNGLVDSGISDENSLIQQLTNGVVPEWVLWLYTFAVATNLTDISMQTGLNDITSIIENQILYTANWYISKVKEFNYGGVLTIDTSTGKPTYSTVNPNGYIIESCTTRDSGNKLILKVKRIDNNILSTDELSALNSYLLKIKPAGIQIQLNNFPPDELTLNMTIIYNGSKNLATIQSSVENEINSYLTNIEYDSTFLTSSLIDKLQVLDGVVDSRFDSATAINSLGVSQSFIHEYLSNAGYMTINPLTPLNTTINYIPR